MIRKLFTNRALRGLVPVGASLDGLQ